MAKVKSKHVDNEGNVMLVLDNDIQVSNPSKEYAEGDEYEFPPISARVEDIVDVLYDEPAKTEEPAS